jgi:heat shock protein HslJ
MRHAVLLLIPVTMLTVLSPAHAQENSLPDPSPQETAAASQTLPDPDLRQTLENHRWTLTSATDGAAQRIDALFPEPAPPFTVTFTDSLLNFQGGCNSFSSSYEINAQGQLLAGSMQSTMMACAPELMQADTALAALLAQPVQIALSRDAGPLLQLQTAANETLGLQGQMLPEALYGPATLIFLEIDAQQLACRNPRNGQTTCLQAREIVFDEQGLRVPPPGPWQPFYDTIEGYTHTPGERNVVRVKRYDRSGEPGTNSPMLYVLDLVIETETVSQ